MPLTSKGTKILKAMEAQYGAKKGEEVFYASKNAGKISGVDSAGCAAKMDAIIKMCDEYPEQPTAGQKEKTLRKDAARSPEDEYELKQFLEEQKEDLRIARTLHQRYLQRGEDKEAERQLKVVKALESAYKHNMASIKRGDVMFGGKPPPKPKR